MTAGNELAPLVYTITVENLGPDKATGVEVTPTEVDSTTTITIDDATTDGCENDPTGADSCTLPDIEADDEATYIVTVDVPSDATGSFTHTWTVSSEIPDLDPLSNTDDTEVEISSKAEMSVTAEATVTGAADDPTTAGLAGSALAASDPVDITITVNNAGPSDATNATLDATFMTSIGTLEVVNSGPYACETTSQLLSCTRTSHPVGVPEDIVVSGALTGSSTAMGTVTVRADNSAEVTLPAPDTTPTPPLADTTTTIGTTTTTTTTTVAATTTTTTVAATPTTTATGALPSTGAGNQIPLLASLVAVLAGIAALIIARRKPEFATAALNRVGISRHDASGAALPVRRINSNGVSTEIEEPRRSTERP